MLAGGETRRGYGRYSRSLVNALLEIDQANEYVPFLDRDRGATVLRVKLDASSAQPTKGV
jgi:hypothetical protein